MKKISIIFVVAIVVIIIIIIITGRSNNEKEKTLPEIPRSSPIPQTMKEFIEISDKGATTVQVCETYGGREIFPINYEKLSSIKDERVFVVQKKETGQIYECIYFGEGEFIITMKSCCWER